MERQLAHLARVPEELLALRESSQKMQQQLHDLPRQISAAPTSKHLNRHSQASSSASSHWPGFDDPLQGAYSSEVGGPPVCEVLTGASSMKWNSTVPTASFTKMIHSNVVGCRNPGRGSVVSDAQPSPDLALPPAAGQRRLSVNLEGTVEWVHDSDKGASKEHRASKTFPPSCSTSSSVELSRPEMEVTPVQSDRTHADAEQKPGPSPSGASRISGIANMMNLLYSDADSSFTESRRRLAARKPRASIDSFIDVVGRHELHRYRLFMLRPNTGPRLLWDAFIIVTIIADGVLVPVGLVYLERASLSRSGLCRVMDVADAAWVLNIALNFLTGYFSAGNTILDPWAVSMRYVRGWLIADLLSICPISLVPEAVWTVGVLKLLRLLRILPLFSGLQREYKSKVLASLKIAISVALLVHVICCCWRLMLRADYPDSQELTVEHELPYWRLYVVDLYWVLMTMSTVGYGDVKPVGTHSQLYSIVAMMISPIVFGSIVSGMNHYTHRLFDDPVESKVAEASRCMSRRRVPKELQYRVEHNLRSHLHQEHMAAMDPALFALLSPALQRELAFALLSSIVTQFPLFLNAPYAFVAEISQAHTWVMCVPGDLVVEEGQLIQELYFVVHGCLQVVEHLPAPKKMHEKSPSFLAGLRKRRPGQCGELGLPKEFGMGAWFGEQCLVRYKGQTETTFRYSAVAAIETELAVITGPEYRRIAEKYPKVLKRLSRLEVLLASCAVDMSQLAYKNVQPFSAERLGSTQWQWGFSAFTSKFSQVSPQPQ